MNRRYVFFVIVLVLVLLTIGCNINTEPETIELEETTEKAVTSELPETTKSSVVLEPMDPDIERAIEAGLIDPSVLESGETQITYKEFSEMLSSMIESFDASKVDEWREVAAGALNSDRKMLRDDGMLTLYYAADVLGVADWPNSDWGVRHDEIGEQWDDISGNYPEFSDWETDIAPFEDAGWNYMTSAYFYCMGRVSRFTGQLVFDYDSINKSMHPADPFTVTDAVKAVVRLKDSITEVYVPLDQAETVNHIPLDLLKKAESMPSVNEEKLPDWHGYAYALWDNPMAHNWRYFSENSIKQLDDVGFNFLRMVYHLNELFEETDEGYVVNIATFVNLDDIIGWCAKYNIHITIQLHQIPGMGTNGPSHIEYVWDIMENTKHYQDSLALYDYMAKRYKNVPSNLLSFTILSEPPKSYFSFEDHAKLVEDLADVIREQTPDRMVIAHTLADGQPLYWEGNTSFMPNYELDPSIVQAESFYPWHNLRRSAYTATLNNWPYDEAPQINNLILGNKEPLILNGDFKKGTKVTYYIEGVLGISYKPEAVCKADGIEITRIPLYDFTIGEDNCNNINGDDAQFGANGEYNGYEFTAVLPEDAKEIALYLVNHDIPSVVIGEVMIKHPAETDQDYIVIDNRYLPTGINYEYGPFTTTLIKCNEIWSNTPAIVNVKGDGTYSSNQTFDVDVFDMNSAHEYFDMWEKWAQQTGGRYMDFEFTSLFSYPEEIRTNYMESVLSLFDEYDIPWVFSADRSQCGGIIKYVGAETTMEELPEWEPDLILPADGSYSVNSDYDYDCYYDDAVISVMQNHMK